MGGRSKKQTVGYRYSLGMHLVFCHGPVDCVSKIRVGEKDVWDSFAAASQQVSINLPKIFGGDKKEGGVVGLVDIAFGEPTQAANDYLLAKLSGAPVPAFRGVLALILRQVYVAANNPYIKPWSIFAKRIPRAWYAAKAEISGNANPAHILYETLTHDLYGLGHSDADIDLDSFAIAADTLVCEGFGLAILWEEDQQSIDDFNASVLAHIDASLYVKPATGKFTLRLARGDYTVEGLPILSPANVVRVERFSQPLPGELVSEVVLKYHDRDTGKDASVSVQDIGVKEMQGGQVVSTSINYPGIPNAALAARVAARELAQLSTPLARATLICTRAAWCLNIADVFRFQWPDYGVADMVMRVVSVSYGELTDGQIRIDAVQDIFSAASAIYSAPAPSGWVSPSSPPAPSPLRVVFEVPYWVLVREVIGNFPSLFSDLDPLEGMIAASGSRPGSDSDHFELWTRTGALDYAERGTAGDFAPVAALTAAIGRTDTVLAISAATLDDVTAGEWAMLDGELLKVIALGAGTITVARGVLDTVPVPHADGAVIFFADGNHVVDPSEWLAGETVDVKLLPSTGLGPLALDAAPADSVMLAARYIRPYPPGQFRINTLTYPAIVLGSLAVSWAHRDRLQQTAYLVEQGEGDIGPELGTTYRVDIYAADGTTLLHTTSGITGTAWTWDDEAAENTAGINRVKLTAERDGFDSWQSHDVLVERAGLGNNLGIYLGEF